MDLHAVLGILRRYWRSIAATTLVLGAASLAFLMVQKPVYASTAMVNFLPKQGGGAGDLKAALDYAQSQAENYAQMAGTEIVLNPVREKLKLPQSAVALAGQCSTTASANQALIRVSCQSSDPQVAADLTNAVADQIPVTLAAYAPSGTAQVLEAKVSVPAVVEAVPSSPNLRASLPMALGLGVLLGLGQAFLRSVLDTRVETPDDVKKLTKVGVIGEIPLDEEKKGDGPRRIEPFSLRAEAYRRLRTNLQFKAVEGHGNVMLVTSSLPGEGKTATASNIAAAFAQTNQRVLLVDCDLRRPRIHDELQLPNRFGLTTALTTQTPVGELVVQVAGMDVLTSGPKPPNPSELLGSPAMQRFFNEVRDSYDIVVFDSPPLLPVTDATVLAKMGAGAVLVADTSRVRGRQLTTALKNLQTVDAPLLGIVLNKIKLGGIGGYYGYGYKSRYSYDYHYAAESSKKGTRAGSRSAGKSSGRRSRSTSGGSRRVIADPKGNSDSHRQLVMGNPVSPISAPWNPVGRRAQNDATSR